MKNVGRVTVAAAAKIDRSLREDVDRRIQKDHPRDLSILSAARRIRSAKPVRESGLDCFAFALVLGVNNDFGAGFARALSRLIG